MSGSITNGIVSFDYTTFSTLYPQFNDKVSEAQAGLLFLQSGLYLDNTGSSPVQDLSIRGMILNMLTAHLAELGIRALNGGGLVGRISSASEGSVSVSTDYNAVKGAEWWLQTGYGAAAWAALAPYRTFRFRPARIGAPAYALPGGYRGY